MKSVANLLNREINREQNLDGPYRISAHYYSRHRQWPEYILMEAMPDCLISGATLDMISVDRSLSNELLDLMK